MKSAGVNRLSADFAKCGLADRKLAAVAPMFLWDVFRNRGVHRAYWIWLGVNVPIAFVVNTMWDTPAWHSAAKWLMGV